MEPPFTVLTKSRAVSSVGAYSCVHNNPSQLVNSLTGMLRVGFYTVRFTKLKAVKELQPFASKLRPFHLSIVDGITEQILCAPENLKLVENIHQRYKYSDVVQQNATDINSKCSSVETLENQRHYEAYQRALTKGIEIKLKYLKMLFFGPPRTGKTSMRRRLVGEIQNLTNEPVQASTGTAEVHDVIVKQVEETIQGGTKTTEGYDVIVKLVEDKTTTSTALIAKSSWSSVKALFGKEKSTHETDLDEELKLLYQFIYRDAPSGEKKTPVSDPVKKRMQNEAEKEETLPVQVKSMGKTNTVRSVIQDESSKAGKVNLNTRIQQEVLLSGKPEYGLNAKEIEEIEMAYEAFTKVMCAPRQDQLKVLLEGTILMNMVDTGGHPAFLEMLPALAMGPALYLIFFRLNQELKKTYQIKYVSEDNKQVQLGDSSYTVEEVICQALSSIACFSCTVPQKPNMPNPSYAAVLIGTHKDLLEGDPESEIKAKDYALQKEISVVDLFKACQKFLRYFSEDQLMFAVDNMNGGEEELTEVHKRLEQIMKNYFDNFSIPASWLMFSIFLRRIGKMGNRTLSLSQCHEIGARLEVRDTDEALWFLHHCVGTVMHFPDVEEIKDIVICDPQVVFDSVTDLILNSFTFNHVDKLPSEDFKRTGQFSLEDIQKTAKRLKCDILPQLKLLKLLEHLNIVAPIKSKGSSPQSDAYQEEVVYFMPAVLKHATKEELHVEQSPTDPVPLMICFKCGFVPVGVFCAMIASLVAQEETLRWKLLKPRDGPGYILCKNKVKFRINGAIDITLISKPKWYEIHIARISTTDKALEEICQQVLETVCETLDQVISKMKYKQNLVSSHSDQSLYELGFKCPKHSNGDHLVINKPKSAAPGVQPPYQSVKSLWLNYLKQGSLMICPLEGGKSIDLRDTKLSQSFVWFGKDTAHGTQSHEFSLNRKNVLNVLHEAKFADGDWAQLGLQLIDHFDSTTIKADHGQAILCMIETISQWLKSDTKASWEKLAEAVSKVVGCGNATAHIIRQKAGIVHTALEATLSPQEGVSSQLHVPLTSTVDTHEYLRGFETFAETSFIIPDSHSHSYEWQQYGLKLHIPRGAVPAGCRVDIKAGFIGQFKIPDELHLVSCVYWLSCSQKFVKPVTLEIEHCASLQDSSQSSSLRFVVAKCSQAELPYQFKVLEKGTFESRSSYGSIKVSQFSLFAISIFKRSQSLQRYCCTHHYIRKDVNEWDVDFIITSDLQASLTVIQNRYSRLDTISGTDFEVQFEKDTICLEIPRSGLYLNGWEIRPLGPLVITKQQVDTFKPGQQGQKEKRVPYCRLQMKLKAKNFIELAHVVELKGAKSPFDYFTITCPPKKYVEKPARVAGERKQSKRTKHSDLEMQKGAETLGIENLRDITSYLNPLNKTAIINLGIVLGLNYNRLNTIKDSQTFLNEMLAGWLQGVDQTGTPTWRKLVEALKDPRVGQNGLASKIEQKQASHLM